MCLFFYFLRQHLPGGQIQLVPLFSREHDICCFCHIRQAFFIHGTDNGLDSGGVAENPGNGDAVWRGVVFLSQAVQDLVELPSNMPYWKGDHAWTVMFFRRQYSRTLPSRLQPASFWILTLRPASMVGQ